MEVGTEVDVLDKEVIEAAGAGVEVEVGAEVDVLDKEVIEAAGAGVEVVLSTFFGCEGQTNSGSQSGQTLGTRWQ